MDNWNVCLINDSFPPTIDGVATAVRNYAQIITAEHGSAAVVTPYYPDVDDSGFPFPVYRYPSMQMSKKLGYRAGIPFSPELMGKMREERFDIIHSHCPISSTLLARSLRDQLQLPLVLTYHTKFDVDIANAVRGKLIQGELIRLLVRNISACDEVWTVSRGAGENLRSMGFQGDYVVMPNGVDFPKGRVSEEEIAASTRDYDLPAGVPVLLFVGRMMWYKGIRIILDALKKLDEESRSFRMVFIGGGGDREEILSYAEGLRMGEKLIFIDPIRDRDRIRAWYCRGDLFLFPSTFDTNGLVVREAAACGLASVLVRGSCAAEDVADGETGFLIEENAASMAETLRRLMDQPELVLRVGDQAREGLYLSWEDAVDNAWDGYGAVIDNYRRGLYQRQRNGPDDAFHNLGALMDWLNRLDMRKTAVEYRNRSWSFGDILSLIWRSKDPRDPLSRQRTDRFL